MCVPFDFTARPQMERLSSTIGDDKVAAVLGVNYSADKTNCATACMRHFHLVSASRPKDDRFSLQGMTLAIEQLHLPVI